MSACWPAPPTAATVYEGRAALFGDLLIDLAEAGVVVRGEGGRQELGVRYGG
jgi:hypothetical protein